MAGLRDYRVTGLREVDEAPAQAASRAILVPVVRGLRQHDVLRTAFMKAVARQVKEYGRAPGLGMVPENAEEGIFDHTAARGTHSYFMGESPHTPMHNEGRAA